MIGFAPIALAIALTLIFIALAAPTADPAAYFTANWPAARQRPGCHGAEADVDRPDCRSRRPKQQPYRRPQFLHVLMASPALNDNTVTQENNQSFGAPVLRRPRKSPRAFDVPECYVGRQA